MTTGIAYVVKARDGTVHRGRADHDIVKTIDRRGDRGAPMVVWEIRLPSGVWTRLWESEVADWSVETIHVPKRGGGMGEVGPVRQ